MKGVRYLQQIIFRFRLCYSIFGVVLFGISNAFSQIQGNTDYTKHPKIEKEAQRLLQVDSDELIDQVDVWVDSLKLAKNDKTWMYLMLYKADALIKYQNQLINVQWASNGKRDLDRMYFLQKRPKRISYEQCTILRYHFDVHMIGF